MVSRPAPHGAAAIQVLRRRRWNPKPLFATGRLLKPNRSQSPAESESHKRGEIEQANADRDSEQDYLPVQNIGEGGATIALQGQEGFRVLRRRHESLRTHRPPQIKRVAGYGDEARSERQDQQDDRAYRKE